MPLDTLPQARLVSVCPGRLRLSIRERRGNTPYFSALASWLGAQEQVLRVRAQPKTASVVIEHRGEAQNFLQALEKEGWATLEKEAAPGENALGLPQAGAKEGVIAILIATAAWQAWRGQILGPAAGLLWYAWNLARE